MITDVDLGVDLRWIRADFLCQLTEATVVIESSCSLTPYLELLRSPELLGGRVASALAGLGLVWGSQVMLASAHSCHSDPDHP